MNESRRKIMCMYINIVVERSHPNWSIINAVAFYITLVLRSGAVKGPFTSSIDPRFEGRGRALVFREETPAFMFWCCWREPKVRVVVLQREATSGAKWLSVLRFVPHSIVSRLRVNPETRGRLEGARRTFVAETLNLSPACRKKPTKTKQNVSFTYHRCLKSWLMAVVYLFPPASILFLSPVCFQQSLKTTAGDKIHFFLNQNIRSNYFYFWKSIHQLWWCTHNKQLKQTSTELCLIWKLLNHV